MKITVLFFAMLKEQVGISRFELEIHPGFTVIELKNILGGQFPGIQPYLNSVLVSINHEFAYDQDVLLDGAEVALFPPVSGGADAPTICRVVEAPIDSDALLEQITLPETGAACVFTGIVRGVTTRGMVHTTLSLEYEAYIPMAEAKMRQVADEIRQRWPDIQGIAILQRIGHLDAGTPITWIACTASHRDMGVFEAARYGIDRLKEIVPVWKKENGPDGSSWVEGHYQPQKGD